MGADSSTEHIPLSHDSVVDQPTMNEFDDAQKDGFNQSVLKVEVPWSCSTKIPRFLGSATRERYNTSSCDRSYLRPFARVQESS